MSGLTKMKIEVYLHNSSSHAELEENYEVDEKIANDLYDALYEVKLIYDTETKELSLP
jgi:succinate dehydrogenase/fumarate reductase-like Fe-S protein